MKSISVRSLTEQQSAFAHAYVLGESAGNGTASAVAAGCPANSAKQAAYRLLRHEGVKSAINKLNQEAITEYATASIHLLGRMVLDKTTHPKLALEAAKTILDRAGYIAPKAAEPITVAEKAIAAMTIAELERRLAEEEARDAAVIDITPDAVAGEATSESPPAAAS